MLANRTYTFTVFISVVAIVAVGCSSDDRSRVRGDIDDGDVITDTADDLEDSRTDTDRTDDGDSHGTNDGDVEPGDSDSFDGFDSSDTPDGDDGGTCECPRSGDVCVPANERVLCVPDGFRDENCFEEGLACPDGYECVDGGYCACDIDAGGDGCRSVCTTHGDCPGYFLCGPGGHCEAPPACSSDIMCPSGKHCVEFDAQGLNGPRCIETGPKADGASCDASNECVSGKCYRDTCATRCLTDLDCPADSEHCNPREGICHVSACRAECPATHQCDSNYCRPPGCQNSSDCTASDCSISLRRGMNEHGVCLVDHEAECKPSELRIGADDPYCRLPIRCPINGGNPCPAGYECVVNQHAGTPYAEQWCSRRVRPGAWPP